MTSDHVKIAELRVDIAELRVQLAEAKALLREACKDGWCDDYGQVILDKQWYELAMKVCYE